MFFINYINFLGKRFLEAAGIGVAAAVGASTAAPLALTAAGFTSAGKSTCFKFVFLFSNSPLWFSF